MSLLRKFAWEMTHITSIVVVIIALMLATHLAGTPRVETHTVGNATSIAPSSTSFPSLVTAQPAPAALPTQALSQKSDPGVVVVGPNDISNRYTLLRVDRRGISPTSDELIVRLHVESLAMEPLVSPFESGMLELRSEELALINPMAPFHHPIPSGNSLNEDVVFRVPKSLRLSNTTLQIHYYNYQKEISLNLSSRKDVE